LREVGFRVTYTTEAGQFTIDSADASLYGYRDARGAAHAFALLPPAEEGGPAQLEAARLRPSLMLGWERGEEGDWRSRLEYR